MEGPTFCYDGEISASGRASGRASEVGLHSLNENSHPTGNENINFTGI